MTISRYGFGLAVIAAIACAMISAQSSFALGLKSAPQQYKTTLKKNEIKQGYIDISNPSHQSVMVQTSVQAFKQIDDNGGLQFYDDKQIALGVMPDLREFELGPREAVRMQFRLTSNDLPKGDVYAAIFFTTSLKAQKVGIGQLVRVGTLLSIVNQSTGERKAEITALSVPFLQVSDTLRGSYSVKNTSKQGGFYPEVSVAAGGIQKTIESSLVFAGRERQNDFRLQTGPGIHLLEVGYGASKKSQLVAILPGWSIAIMLVVLVVMGVEGLLLRKRRKAKRDHSLHKP